MQIVHFYLIRDNETVLHKMSNLIFSVKKKKKKKKKHKKKIFQNACLFTGNVRHFLNFNMMNKVKPGLQMSNE